MWIGIQSCTAITPLIEIAWLLLSPSKSSLKIRAQIALKIRAQNIGAASIIPSPSPSLKYLAIFSTWAKKLKNFFATKMNIMTRSAAWLVKKIRLTQKQRVIFGLFPAELKKFICLMFADVQFSLFTSAGTTTVRGLEKSRWLAPSSLMTNATILAKILLAKK